MPRKPKTPKAKTVPVQPEAIPLEQPQAQEQAPQQPIEQRTTTYFYWLKERSYVSDTERWEPGLYATQKRVERLHKSPPSVVEIFENTIPETTLAELAKRYGTQNGTDLLRRLVIHK